MKELMPIAYCCILVLIIGTTLRGIQYELNKIDWTYYDKVCSAHDMKYIYNRIDICVDKKGQMFYLNEFIK